MKRCCSASQGMIAHRVTPASIGVRRSGKLGMGRAYYSAMDFKGKKVIAIGERDGVQGGVIADVASQLGAEVVFTITQCFV